MKASELIRALQKAKRDHGDLDVCFPSLFLPSVIRRVTKRQDQRGDFIGVDTGLDEIPAKKG